MRSFTALSLLLGLLLLAGCRSPQADAPAQDATASAPAALHTLPVPAGPGSAQPNLVTGDDGRAYLSWIEPADTLHRLRYAVLEAAGDDARWSDARDVAEGADWFVNWADFPALAVSPAGPTAAHYLARSGDAPYAYDVHLTRSADGGASWTDAVVPHDDGTPTEHGFVSMVPTPGGGVFLTWLDGRNYAETADDAAPSNHTAHGHGAVMTLRYAFFDADGRRTARGILDDATCDCCQTAAVRTSDGILVAYRDRSDDEVRDIYTVRVTDAGPTPPQPVAADGWQINACPVNGPALDAVDGRAVVAWFHAADDRPTVQVAFSDDAGATFSPPVTVAADRPLGRVDVVALPSGAALVSWLAATDDGATVRVRRVDPAQPSEAVHTLTTTLQARASGFPHLARHGDAVVAAWTEADDPSQVRSALLPAAWLAP